LIDNEDRSRRLGIAFDIFSPQGHGDVEISAPLGIHEEAGIEGQVGDYREQKVFSGKKRNDFCVFLSMILRNWYSCH